MCAFSPPASVDQHLEHSAVLLSELHQQQLERLGHAPQKSSEGHVVLSGPSEREAVTGEEGVITAVNSLGLDVIAQIGCLLLI